MFQSKWDIVDPSRSVRHSHHLLFTYPSLYSVSRYVFLSLSSLSALTCAMSDDIITKHNTYVSIADKVAFFTH